jgi:signal transduction histidine kinase
VGQYIFDRLNFFSGSFLNLFSDNLDTQIQKLEAPRAHPLPSELSILFANTAQRVLKESQKKRDQFLQAEIERERTKSAVQLAHNIRSPLTALKVLTEAQNGLPEEEKCILKEAATRIQEIANEILTRYSETPLERSIVKPQSIDFILQESIRLKRIEYSPFSQIQIELEIHPSAFGVQAQVCASELSQILSNLMNNSIDAFTETRGQISILLERKGSHWIQISLSDNGRGIPDELLPQIGNQAISFGKIQGYGIGLSHAFQMIQQWAGRIHVERILPNGTRVVIQLPVAFLEDQESILTSLSRNDLCPAQIPAPIIPREKSPI